MHIKYKIAICQQTHLYWRANCLKPGENDMIVFDLYQQNPVNIKGALMFY